MTTHLERAEERMNSSAMIIIDIMIALGARGKSSGWGGGGVGGLNKSEFCPYNMVTLIANLKRI